MSTKRLLHCTLKEKSSNGFTHFCLTMLCNDVTPLLHQNVMMVIILKPNNIIKNLIHLLINAEINQVLKNESMYHILFVFVCLEYSIHKLAKCSL